MERHFVKAYDEHTEKSLSKNGRRRGFELAIGGNFIPFGILQRNLLLQYGLTPDSSLVDVGCGSGRLAFALRDLKSLDYLGLDVVQDLLDYAAEISERPDWTFVRSTEFKIPADDNSKDLVCAFSVFTHLHHPETYTYLQEIRRILKPGGRLVFSFLEYGVPAHWAVFKTNLAAVHAPGVLNEFIDPVAIRTWCQHLQYKVVAMHPGSEMHIVTPEPVTMEDGSVISGLTSMGQSVCVIEKPA